MSESRQLLCDTAQAIFAAHAGSDPAEPGRALDEAGFPALLVAESNGGFGGDWVDFTAIATIAGGCAISYPVGEHMLACRAASLAGVDLPDGVASLCADFSGDITGDRVTGTAVAVPWSDATTSVVLATGGVLVLLDARSARVELRENMAGGLRANVELQGSAATATAAWEEHLALGAALLRTAQICGAADAVLQLTVEYASTRSQFGRTIDKFQAVQHSLASLACEVAAVQCAVRGAALAADRLGLAEAALEIGAARLRANRAVPEVVGIAHQIHGAIGFTREYDLQRLTRQLMACRSEYGNDRYWAEQLGDQVLPLGGAGTWDRLTRHSDRYLA